MQGAGKIKIQEDYIDVNNLRPQTALGTEILNTSEKKPPTLIHTAESPTHLPVLNNHVGISQ